MEFETLGWSVVGSVVQITLRQPFLSPLVHHELYQAWRAFRYDRNLSVAILTGQGDTFSTGDLVPNDAPEAKNSEDLGWWYEHYRVRESNVWKPLIIAVNGRCSGSALTFIGQGDIVVAGDNASFVLPTVESGAVPWREVTYLSDRVSLGVINQLALLGSMGLLQATRAQTVGLVNEVVPAEQLGERAWEIANAIAGASGDAVRGSAACLHNSRDLGYLDGLMMAFSIADRYGKARDAHEGPIAFTEKRQAAWKQ